MLTLTEDKLIEIFIDVDDFMKDFQAHLHHHTIGQTDKPQSLLHPSEIITVVIGYHFSRMDCFKSYYQLLLCTRFKGLFPALPCYARFIALKKHYFMELFAFLCSRMAPPSPQANFVDSKKLESCHIKRAGQHRTMKGLASKGKTSTGWFFGLKLHLVINQYGQLCKFTITSGKVSDNNKRVLGTLFKDMKGVFFGDKGYLTKLRTALSEKGVELITKTRKNMKKIPLSPQKAHFLKQRGLIETVFGLMTFQADIDHTRHRSQMGMFINLFSGMIAYTYFDSLPKIKNFMPPVQIELFKEITQ